MINPVHNQGIRLAVVVFRTSPIDSVLCNIGEPPLELKRQNCIFKYISKIKNLSDHIS